jgi:hypothetical protein
MSFSSALIQRSRIPASGDRGARAASSAGRCLLQGGQSRWLEDRPLTPAPRTQHASHTHFARTTRCATTTSGPPTMRNSVPSEEPAHRVGAEGRSELVDERFMASASALGILQRGQLLRLAQQAARTTLLWSPSLVACHRELKLARATAPSSGLNAERKVLGDARGGTRTKPEHGPGGPGCGAA